MIQDQAAVFETADKQFNLVLSALKTGRSLISSYNLQSDIQSEIIHCQASVLLTPPPVFLHIQTDEEAALFEPQLSTIVALTKGCKSAKVVREIRDIPEGCGGTIVTPTVAVHVLVRVSTLSEIP